MEERSRETHSIHDEELTADVLARVAREEDDGARKVGGLAPPAQSDEWACVGGTIWD